jgi:exodeoxyribonuclease VII small subunit
MRARFSTAMSAPENTDISFEQAMERLDEIVSALEGDRMPLGDLISSYEEGMQLLKTCELTPFEAGREDSQEEKTRGPARRRPASTAKPDAEADDGEIRLF